MGKERGSAEETIKSIRRKTRRQYSAEEKIRIVIEGLRGDRAKPVLQVEGNQGC
jgi:transposase